MTEEKFSAKKVLSDLKDFQLKTVNYVFNQFYKKENPTHRFLVADEVGLGKTLVARGIIARTLEHLQEQQDRVDVIYICSNASIATQNINRLNVSGRKEFALASRLTLLPTQVQHLNKNKVNFISFTPNTTLNIVGQVGKFKERLIIYKILQDSEFDENSGLLKMLKCNMCFQNWEYKIETWKEEIDKDIANKFLNSVSRDRQLVERLRQCCIEYSKYGNSDEDYYYIDTSKRNLLISDLRQLLAQNCIESLTPNLIILDEFQRFRNVLLGDSYETELANKLFNVNDVRVLLLSATPYKMYTLDYERNEDHYPDFIKTMDFLIQDEGKLRKLQQEMNHYRNQLYKISNNAPEVQKEIESARNQLQDTLLTVMSRTERVGMTKSMKSMQDDKVIPASIEPSDILHAAAVDRIANVVEAPEIIEYWKSSPYLLNFSKNYMLRRQIERKIENPPKELVEAIRADKTNILDARKIHNFKTVDSANPRMRVLFESALDNRMWKLLWLPPSLPYTIPSRIFTNGIDVTKMLIFSKWNMVPDAISSICSYEAERRMLGGRNKNIPYKDLTERISPLLSISKNKDKLTGMHTIAWLFPSTILAKALDPLEIACKRGVPIPRREMLSIAENKCKELIKLLPGNEISKSGDQRWYWAAPAMLEKETSTQNWIRYNNCEINKGEQWTILKEHWRHFLEACEGKLEFGPKPQNLSKVLAEMSLAGPGICALRALKRIAPETPFSDYQLLSSATNVANAFRSMFNFPQSVALLQGKRKIPYWRKALHYGINGNLQSLLDEQVHVLLEHLGLKKKVEHDRFIGVSQALVDSLSIHSAPVQINELKVGRGKIESGKPINIRTRFAVRFGTKQGDKDSNLARVGKVQDAFNSPFRPFVLASTSVGQEGLDFHTWCHALVHWNLPSNPVDLEQREGRIHRYKGHAVRKNIAKHYGLKALNGWNAVGDPWEHLFEIAKNNRPSDCSDIVPYWVFEKKDVQGSKNDSIDEDAKIERRVPILPYSKEEWQFELLKKNLALYRLVIGQPRQEDLLKHLSQTVESEEEAEKLVRKFSISLQPPSCRE